MPSRSKPSPDRLALNLYAAVLDGDSLDNPLIDIADALGAQAAFATRVSFAGPDVLPADKFSQTGFDPAALAEYASTWMPHDPWMQAGGKQPPGVIEFDRLVPERTYRASLFWNEFASRRAPMLHSMAASITEPDETRCVMAFNRSPGQGGFDAQDVSLLKKLYPHLRRAFIAEARRDQDMSHRLALRAGLDGTTQGVAVLGLDGRLVLANAALLGFAARRDGLTVGTMGVEVTDPATQQTLSRQVAACLAAAAAGRVGPLPGPASLKSQRPSGEPGWQVQVLPLLAGDTKLHGGFSGVTLLVDAPIPRFPSVATVRRTLGLSEAEAMAALALAQGRTVTEHATARGVSPETIRSHLASIRLKTGCRRQSEIVALVATLPR